MHPRAVSTYPKLLILILAMLLASACGSFGLLPNDTGELAPQMTPEVLNSYPHDPGAFTQGLLLHDGDFYESTGQYGESTLRQVDVETGRVVRQVDLPGDVFAEGLTLVDDRLIQITWRERFAYVYDLDFNITGTFDYETEGWGICYDGTDLYMSDGSSTLYVRDPETFAVTRMVAVTRAGEPVMRINELECVDDRVYANVWQTDEIVIIDATTGEVLSTIDASGLLTEDEQASLFNGAVLNGIAYNPESDTFYITGKYWPRLFEVRFISPMSGEIAE
jgi:glutaminyl-peptide cyclotransferase